MSSFLTFILVFFLIIISFIAVSVIKVARLFKRTNDGFRDSLRNEKSGSSRNSTRYSEANSSNAHQHKIFREDEGEYTDFEEVQ